MKEYIVSADGRTEHREDARAEGTISAWWYVLALLFPLAGVIAGIYRLANDQVGPGLALFATSALGFIVNLYVIFGA